MKKFKMLILAAVLCVAAVAVQADSYTYTDNLTNGESVTTSALPVSGWLDKIEVSQNAAGTCTVVVATYDGTTAVDTYVSLSSWTDTSKVLRPRFIGTGNTGTALAAANIGTASNAVPTLLPTAPYERPMIGGNTKIVLTGESDDNDVKIVVYYEPLKK